MKRGTIEHPKTILFANELGIEIPHATGILECLWHWVAKYTPQGNIGKFSNRTIAEGIRTKIEPDTLIIALTNSRWIDQNDQHRYIVHDWSEHADDSVHLKLARSIEFFADGVKPRLTRLSEHERVEIEQKYICAQEAHKKRRKALKNTLPSPPLPSLSPPLALPSHVEEGGFKNFWEAYPKKVSKGRARKAWEKLSPNEQLQAQILTALERAKTSEQWSKEKGRYIPHAATWLGAEGWEDKHDVDLPEAEDWVQRREREMRLAEVAENVSE